MSYVGLAAVFLTVPTLLAVLAAVVVRPGRSWWLVTAVVLTVLLMLTALFDNLMIHADLFRFDANRLLGVRIGRAPLEDFAWPLAAVLLLPTLWMLLDPRRTRPPLARPELERKEERG